MRALRAVVDRNCAASRLGMVFAGSVLTLTFGAALGTHFNVTLGVIALCGACIVLNPSLHPCLHTRWNASDWSLLIFVVTTLIAITVSLGRVAVLPVDVLLHSLALTLLCPLAYVVGSTVAGHADAAGIKKVFHFALLIVIGFLLLKYLQPELISDDAAVVGSYYQYSGDCLAVFALVHLATKPKGASIGTVILVIPALMLVGSRASVAAYVAALMASNLMPSIAIVCSIALLGWPWIEGLLVTAAPDLLDLSRVITSLMAALLEGREDASLLERLEYQQMAIASIANQPLMGDFGYDYLWNGYLGGFSHTALDLWAQYGIATFVAFAATIVCAPLASVLLRTGFGRPATAGSWRCMPLMVFLIVQFTLFRHPESVVLFFGIGALSGLSARPVSSGRVGGGVWRGTNQAVMESATQLRKRSEA